MRNVIIVCLTAMFLSIFSIGSFADDKKPKTLEERFSYSLGIRMATDIKNRGFEIDHDLIIQGFKDALTGNSPMMTMDEVQAAIMEFQQKNMQEMAKEKKAEGKAFLSENAKKEGVKVTSTGLQYQELKAGTGAFPTADDKVKVHYKGSLLNGQEFDSSYKRGEPATFGVNQVIKGWTEGLQLMKEGSRYKFFIPAELAYGDRGAGRAIGPGETLLFEVELIEIVK